MNWDRMAGSWNDSKNKVRERWGKLTDEDLRKVSGRREQLVMVLTERYGWPREQAERQIKDFEQTAGEEFDTAGSMGERSGQNAPGGQSGGMSGQSQSGASTGRTNQSGQSGQGGQFGQSGQGGQSGQHGQGGQVGRTASNKAGEAEEEEKSGQKYGQGKKP